MKISFGNSISTIYRHLQIYINQKLSIFGFGSGQYLFFINIAKEDGISQKELSEKLLIDKATTAKAIKKLSKLGYISSTQNNLDKRSFYLNLTTKGKLILPEVSTVLQQTTNILQQGLSFDQVDMAEKLLNQLLINITNENRTNKESK